VEILGTGAIAPKPNVMEECPVALPSADTRSQVGQAAGRLVSIFRSHRDTRKGILDWLKVEHGVEKPTQKLQAVFDLDSDCLITEVRKSRSKKSPLTLAALRSLREEYTRTILPAQGHRIKIGGLGRMANSAFGGKRNLCGTFVHLFTIFVVALVVDNKYNVYVRYLVTIENPKKLRKK
jgi:hypothetical protein